MVYGGSCFIQIDCGKCLYDMYGQLYLGVSQG